MSVRRCERLFLLGASSHRILLLLPFSSSHWILHFCLPSSSSQQRLHCFAWEVEELTVKEQLVLLAYFTLSRCNSVQGQIWAICLPQTVYFLQTLATHHH